MSYGSSPHLNFDNTVTLTFDLDLDLDPHAKAFRQRFGENCCTDSYRTCFICRRYSMRICDLTIQWPWLITLTLTASAITRFYSFKRNFLAIRRRNLILVSRVGFWGSRNPMVPLDFNLTLTLTLTIFTKFTSHSVNGLCQKDGYIYMH